MPPFYFILQHLGLLTVFFSNKFMDLLHDDHVLCFMFYVYFMFYDLCFMYVLCFIFALIALMKGGGLPRNSLFLYDFFFRMILICSFGFGPALH